VAASLSVAPTSAHQKGFVRKPGSRPAPHGVWLLRVDGRAPAEPDELLRKLLARVPGDTAFWARMRARYQVRLGFAIHTGGWNRGFDLGADVMRRVDVVGAGLGFDLYFHADET